MSITTINIVTIIFAFIIGAVGGAAFVFFFRRFRLTREMRTAERKASRLKAEAEFKAREVVREAKEETEKQAYLLIQLSMA